MEQVQQRPPRLSTCGRTVHSLPPSPGYKMMGGQRLVTPHLACQVPSDMLFSSLLSRTFQDIGLSPDPFSPEVPTAS